ncbi:M-phase phosphoprotein 8-like isoform X2 [Ruditapes philippinarum]|uniref:M-phase phosphoprotein 8-like isoform X2 n=1 Tax=Ruditapes philippinarum TaxID=129788 RepID=UPI00295ADDD3|nr:M-phase phosphoprotein 8-like isoform X2 [Ruditapes philippinarum]
MAERGDETGNSRKKVNKSEQGMDSSGEEEELFEVEKIIGKSKVKGSVLYKVRWKGYSAEEDTWEPRENLECCQDLIEEYDAKQQEIAKRRTEERKNKQAIMEGRIDSSDSSDSNSPYPANFKNTFWKELEAGRVNVFDNDMYSKVKKRSMTLQSRNKDQTSSSTDESTSKPESKKKRNLSDSDKTSTPKPSGSASRRPTSTAKKSKPTSDGKTGLGPDSSACCNDFGIVIKDSDTDQEMNSIPKYADKEYTRDITVETDSSDSELIKPSLNLVIKKMPEITADMGNKCSVKGQETCSSYTVLPKTSDIQPFERSTGKKSSSSNHQSSSKKKKKHHKHHKHKSRNSSPRGHGSQDKKRKVSSTSLSHFPTESSKVPKLDTELNPKESNVLGEHNKNIDNSNPDLINEDNNDNNRLFGSLPSDINEKTRNDSAKNKKEAISETRELAPMKSKNSEVSDSLPSSDLLQFNRSQNSDTPDIYKCSSSISVNEDECSNSVRNSEGTKISANTELSRQISENTLDSGIHSPASEKSEALFRQGMDERLVPPFSSQAFKDIPTDQDLDIALDDIDWDLFEAEVTLEPVTVTNEEFANAVMAGDYKLVKRALLGESKYDLERPDMDGKTLLMWAVHHGHDDISDLLIEHGADINAQMNNGMSPLMIACHSAEISTVNLLLELGAKVNLESKDRKTALIYAAKRGHNQILWLLLECGANFNTTSEAGHTALDYLRLLRHPDTEVILTSHIQRVMSEFNKQVSITLNGTAKVLTSLFKPQLFNICDSEKFEIAFQHNLRPPNSGIGYLLFIGHATFSNQEVMCRLYGPNAVRTVTLNGHHQSCLTEEGNFVLAFSPLMDGKNVLTINTIKTKDSKAKLIVCAYMAQLLQ